jgi:conjugal transfer pilus assembly protein TraL
VDEIGYIPKSLEAQERFLWWDFDQAILFLLIMGTGVISGAMLAGMVCGALLAWQYGRIKTGKHPKFVEPLAKLTLQG